MAQFHFVEDYEKVVAHLISAHPIDEAMALAVGGDYHRIGSIELHMLLHAGLCDGMSVFDLGCGSGRLAHAIGTSGLKVDYLGTDVVQALLNYAKKKSPRHFRFQRHRELSVPAPDSSLDIACAFSVFTHLLHAETYLYLQDMQRALKSGGRVVFSFLEFSSPGHWAVFQNTVEQQRHSTSTQLNTFIERNAIGLWAERLGYEVVEFIEGGHKFDGESLGQCAVILQKR